MMWFKVAVVVAAVMVQLSGNMSHIFNFYIFCHRQAELQLCFCIKASCVELNLSCLHELAKKRIA